MDKIYHIILVDEWNDWIDFGYSPDLINIMNILNDHLSRYIDEETGKPLFVSVLDIYPKDSYYEVEGYFNTDEGPIEVRGFVYDIEDFISRTKKLLGELV